MTTQMNSNAPTVVDDPRNPQTPQPHDDNDSSPPPHPKRRWFAPIGLAAVIGIAGVAILVDDAYDQPGPTAPENRESPAPNDGQTLEPGQSDHGGRTQAAPADVETSNGLPRHLQDFEARVRASEPTATLPRHLQDFEARVRASEPTATLPQHLQDFEARVRADEARVRADEARGTRPQAGMPDGYWVANSPSTVNRSTATTADNGQVRLPGMPDGYWVANSPPTIDHSPATTADNGQVRLPGMPDGYWVANSSSTIDHSPATTADNGQVRLPGMPDGYWQWEGSASTTSAT